MWRAKSRPPEQNSDTRHIVLISFSTARHKQNHSKRMFVKRKCHLSVTLFHLHSIPPGLPRVVVLLWAETPEMSPNDFGKFGGSPDDSEVIIEGLKTFFNTSRKKIWKLITASKVINKLCYKTVQTLAKLQNKDKERGKHFENSQSTSSQRSKTFDWGPIQFFWDPFEWPPVGPGTHYIENPATSL